MANPAQTPRGAARRDMARLIHDMTEDEAEMILAEYRFGSRELQCCPGCGAIARHYRRRTRRQWRCRYAACGHTFSVTSGTTLDSSKLTYRQILRFLVHFEASPKGVGLVSATNAVGLTEKSAQQNLMKFREALMTHADHSPLTGTVHMDGAYVCGIFRRSNRRVKKAVPEQVLAVHGTPAVKRRLPAINRHSHANMRRAKNKRVLMCLVQASSEGGAERVIVAMCRSENARDVTELAQRYVAPGSRIFTDENPAYDELRKHFEHHVVNHSEEYSTPEGVSDNLAEAFFSRLRRGQYGVHHRFRPLYMAFYGWEYAWRETHRRLPQSSKVRSLGRALLMPGYSRYWRGYHGGQRRRLNRRVRRELVMGAPPQGSNEEVSRQTETSVLSTGRAAP
jgi:transposase-like protein